MSREPTITFARRSACRAATHFTFISYMSDERRFRHDISRAEPFSPRDMPAE